MISLRNLTVLAGGKYLSQKFCAKVAQSNIDPTGKEFNHSLALSFKEKGNNLSLMASSRTSLTLNISHISNWNWTEF